jgi:hypothetical protein
MSYEKGFEDALELIYADVEQSKNKKDALQRIRYLLGLIKEHKIDRIKQMIGAIQ